MIPATQTDIAPLIQVSNVGKDYAVIDTGSGRLRTVVQLLTGRAVKNHFRALAGIDLTMMPGESWGIIGENGAGKSTLMKIIAGVVKPSTGTLQVNGRISALLELGTGFHPEYTGRENIYLASALMGRTRRETESLIDSILEFADIGEHIDHPVKTYSSGMVVRLGFAIATAMQPDLLVTDEVLAVGDESFQKKCMRWIERYRARGGALLLCSHSMYHIQSLCERAIWIHQGECRMSGEVHSVTQAYAAYQEAKSNTEANQAPVSNPLVPCLVNLRLADAGGNTISDTAHRSTVVVHGEFRSPDDTPTVVMVGIVRADGTPVYGTFSNSAQFTPTRIANNLFAFSLEFPSLALLPGKYRIRAHTLDDHALRLFDTREVELVVSGRTTDHGLVHLQHRWFDGGAQQ